MQGGSTIKGIPRPFGDNELPKENGAVAGAAVAIVLPALIGGGVGDAASISAVDEFSISTTRLRRMGGHPMKLDARWTRTAATTPTATSSGSFARIRASPTIARSSNARRKTTSSDSQSPREKCLTMTLQ